MDKFIQDAVNTLPPLRDVIAEYDLRADKKLGQNFLFDLNITDKIVRQAGDLKDAHVFEIGPGPGGLTRKLVASKAKKITAIEFDPRAVKALAPLKDISEGRLDILEADALTVNILDHAQADRIAVVANLPYNIATPLLTGWLELIYHTPGRFCSLTLMFQKEVAARIAAPVNTRAYGRLSVLAQWLCDVKILFDLPPQAFTPAPKIVSSVIRLTPKKQHDWSADFQAVEEVTAHAFGQRRKMIRSSLKAYQPYFKECGLDETLRAEALSVEDFITLARAIS